jgi:hypothetical protein
MRATKAIAAAWIRHRVHDRSAGDGADDTLKVCKALLVPAMPKAKASKPSQRTHKGSGLCIKHKPSALISPSAPCQARR